MRGKCQERHHRKARPGPARPADPGDQRHRPDHERQRGKELDEAHERDPRERDGERGQGQLGGSAIRPQDGKGGERNAGQAQEHQGSDGTLVAEERSEHASDEIAGRVGRREIDGVTVSQPSRRIVEVGPDRHQRHMLGEVDEGQMFRQEQGQRQGDQGKADRQRDRQRTEVRHGPADHA